MGDTNLYKKYAGKNIRYRFSPEQPWRFAYVTIREHEDPFVLYIERFVDPLQNGGAETDNDPLAVRFGVLGRLFMSVEIEIVNMPL